MKVAFYKASTGDWSDKLIGWWTRGPYSHCELIFDDGEFFSSSGSDGGVRFRKTDPYPGHWDYVELPTWGNEVAMREAAQKEIGKKYDWFGLFGFVLPFPFFHTNYRTWFCSEIIAYLMVKGGMMPTTTQPWTFSPNTLYETLIELQIEAQKVRNDYEKLRTASTQGT